MSYLLALFGLVEVYNVMCCVQESAVHVGTADYTANAGGWRTKAEVRIQVEGSKLKVSWHFKINLFN